MSEALSNPALCLQLVLEKELIKTYFQPIYSLSNRALIAYEALTRGPENSALQRPEDLFSCAEAAGCLSELEILCRKKAIQRFAELGLPGFLFLNISPSTLLDPAHPQGETLRLLSDVGLAIERVVIEITEVQKIEDEPLFQKAITHYRQLGFQIAIDDLGSGNSGLRQWSELLPDIVKIDRYFVDNCHQDSVKRAFLESIVALAQATGTRVVAEGIERLEELLFLQSLGIDMVQGYLLKKPQLLPSHEAISVEILPVQPREKGVNQYHFNSIAALRNTQALNFIDWAGDDQSIGHLAIEGQVLGMACSVEQAKMIFACEPQLQSIVVLNEALYPQGVVYRNSVFELLSSRYGSAVYAQQPLQKIIQAQFEVADGNASMQQISTRLVERLSRNGQQLVVLNAGVYVGVIDCNVWPEGILEQGSTLLAESLSALVD